MKKRGNLKYCVIVLILSWVLSPVLAQQANTLFAPLQSCGLRLDDAEKTKAGRI